MEESDHSNYSNINFLKESYAYHLEQVQMKLSHIHELGDSLIITDRVFWSK